MPALLPLSYLQNTVARRNYLAEQTQKSTLVSQLTNSKTATPEPIEIFYAYALEDEAFANLLQKHLLPLKRAGMIDEWHTGRIMAGQNARSEIEQHLGHAQIILLLISPDFINAENDYIEHAMERQRQMRQS